MLMPGEKHAVAVHESGHALVAALAEGRPRRQGHGPAGGPGARCHRTAAVRRTTPLQRELSEGLARGPARRPGRRAARARRGVVGRVQRPRRATDLATRMVREFGMSEAARPDRVPRGRLGVPRRRWRPHVQPPVRRGHPGGDRQGSRRAAPRHAEERAVALLKDHRSELDALVNVLLEMETFYGAEVYRLAGLSLQQSCTALAGAAHHQRPGARRPRSRPHRETSGADTE